VWETLYPLQGSLQVTDPASLLSRLLDNDSDAVVLFDLMLLDYCTKLLATFDL